MIIDHVNWHSKRPEDGGRNISRGQKGSGEEFLVWHKWFIARYNRWRKRSGKPIIEPWSGTPSELNLIGPLLNKAIETYFKDINVEIIAEPGRFMVGNSHTLVLNIISKKEHINKENGEKIDELDKKWLSKLNYDGTTSYVNGWQINKVEHIQAGVRIYKDSNLTNQFVLDIFNDINKLLHIYRSGKFGSCSWCSCLSDIG